MKKEFPTKEDLMKWLRNATSAVILSISLTGGVHEVYFQASSARVLSEISQLSPDYVREGCYLVEYEGREEDDESEELDYTNIATAFTFQARLAQHPGKIIGGLDNLRNSLSGYEYTAKIELEQSGYVGHLLIVIPESPEELESLKETLHNLSIAYIFPDGTGTINQNNMKMGRGIWS